MQPRSDLLTAAVALCGRAAVQAGLKFALALAVSASRAGGSLPCGGCAEPWEEALPSPFHAAVWSHLQLRQKELLLLPPSIPVAPSDPSWATSTFPVWVPSRGGAVAAASQPCLG